MLARGRSNRTYDISFQSMFNFDLVDVLEGSVNWRDVDCKLSIIYRRSMGKKPILFFSIISLFIHLSLFPANAAVKAGSACKTAGLNSTISGKTFTCVKSGKKLVWDKGVKVKPVNTSKNEAINQNSNKVTRYAEALVIQKLISNAQQNNSATSVNAKWIYEGNTSEEVTKATEKGLLESSKFYAQLGFTSESIKIFVTRNESWLRDQMLENKCTLNSYLDSLGWYAPYSCQDGSSYIVSRHWSSISLPGGLQGLAFQHVLAHEYFHLIQQTYGGRYGNVAPIWFWEGGAHFYSVLAYSDWNKNQNYENWLDYLLKDWRDDTYQPCKPIKIQDIPNTGSWELRRCGYSKGAKAVEFFVSKYGFEKYKQILIQLSNDNFSSAFEKTTGQDLIGFYSDVDKFLASQGWN